MKKDDPFDYKKKLKNAVRTINHRVSKGDTITFGLGLKVLSAEYTEEWGGEAYINTLDSSGREARYNVGSTIFSLL